MPIGALGGAPPCERCGDRVYFNDQRMYMMKYWHKKCFKCDGCSKMLPDIGLATLLEDEKSLACNQCLRKLTARRPSGDGASENVDQDDPKNCPRCGKTVYFAEEKLAMGRKWHKPCFSCAECHQKLDSRNMADHEGEVYCKSCHGKKFGPQGYGYAGGAGTMLSMDKGKEQRTRFGSGGSNEAYSNKEDPECCPRCGKRVYFAEQVLALHRKWHKLCFKCGDCGKKVDSTTASDHEGELYCKACHGKKFGPRGYGYAGGAGTMLSMDKGMEQESRTGSGGSTNEYSNKEDPECCPRCGKRVYFAEQLLALNRKWHKLCFKCGACGKKVDSTSAADHGGELYCKPCHGKRFGPKGYGYAGGAGTMLSMETGNRYEVTRENVPHTAEAYMAPVSDKFGDMKMDNGDSKSRSKWGGGDYCPRCNKTVYAAEKKMGAGNAYHATCFTCNACSKKLDSSVLTEKEGEIYCKNCYGKNFGPKGYGFGSGAGILQTN